MNLSKNFTLTELCKSITADRLNIKNEPGNQATINNMRAVCINVLQPLRDYYNIPFSPLSGFRSVQLNNSIGGAKKSQHLNGQAVDIEIPGVDNLELALWISKNLDFDQLILEKYRPGVENSGWVHVSYAGAHNRNEVLTYNNGRYIQGLMTKPDEVKLDPIQLTPSKNAYINYIEKNGAMSMEFHGTWISNKI